MKFSKVNPNPEEYYTVKRLVAFSGVTTRLVEMFIHEGILKVTKRGNTWYIPTPIALKFIEFAKECREHNKTKTDELRNKLKTFYEE